MSKTSKMRLIANDFDGFKGEKRHTYVKGDLVELSQNQAKCFADQFEDPRVQDELVAKAARDQVIRDKQEAEDAEAAAEAAKAMQDAAKKELAEEQATGKKAVGGSGTK